jgi:hypothetical protein
MAEDLIVAKGTVQGTIIKLEETTSLPDGQEVIVTIRPLREERAGAGVDHHDDLTPEQAAEADETLQTIYRMRHMGRGIIHP